MKNVMMACVIAVSGSALAADTKAPAPAPTAAAPAPTAAAPAPTAAAPAPMAMDWSKVGPAARKPTDEKKTKKEIEDFYKAHEAAEMKGDWDALVAMHDFPIYMATDTLKGMPQAKEYSKEEFTAMMKPMMETAKETKTTHKPTVTVLSDSLVNVTDEFVMTTGKNKVAGRNMSMLIKTDGNWKWKVMVEAGWGEEPKAATAAAPAATGTAPAPSNNSAKTPAAAPVAPAPAKK